MHVYTDMEVALVLPLFSVLVLGASYASPPLCPIVIFLIALASLKKNYKQNTITV